MELARTSSAEERRRRLQLERQTAELERQTAATSEELAATNREIGELRGRLSRDDGESPLAPRLAAAGGRRARRRAARAAAGAAVRCPPRALSAALSGALYLRWLLPREVFRTCS